jgi:radical SAM protein with 4Fe4S-binding SPASM domain
MDGANAKKMYDKCYGIHFINQIDANGGIYACGCFVGNDRYLFGNLNDGTYKSIMMSESRQDTIKKVENIPDKKNCDDFCRCHNINKYLWRHRNPPRDVNFI